MTNEERIADLERRVKELEDIVNKQVPWNPLPWTPPIDGPWPIIPTNPTIPNIPVDDEGVKCPNCGMVWKGVMCYSCPNNNCPMGAGPTMFKSE